MLFYQSDEQNKEKMANTAPFGKSTLGDASRRALAYFYFSDQFATYGTLVYYQHFINPYPTKAKPAQLKRIMLNCAIT